MVPNVPSLNPEVDVQECVNPAMLRRLLFCCLEDIRMNNELRQALLEADCTDEDLVTVIISFFIDRAKTDFSFIKEVGSYENMVLIVEPAIQAHLLEYVVSYRDYIFNFQ